jgi:hypothetical protein
MKSLCNRYTVFQFVLLISLAGTMLLGGCARYARNVNALNEPSATVHGGSGEVYVIIPENQKTQSPDVKWVLGSISDDENRKIDEVFSPRSPAEIIQAAFSLEFKKAGYTVITATKRPVGEQRVIDITKAEVVLDQVSGIVDIKSKCRVLVGVDILKKGQLLKRLQYEATSSNMDIKDRDLLAESVLHDSLQSIMLKAVPELHILITE